MNDDDFDETARVILMDVRNDPTVRAGRRSGFGEFVRAMRDEYGHVGLVPLQKLYVKYMGWDSRTRATHDIDTGKPL